MNNSFKLLFYLKKPRVYKEGPQPIYLRITVAGKRTEMAIQRESNPDIWNKVTGRQQGLKEPTRQLNAYLDSLVSRIYECQNELIRNNVPVTADSIKRRYTGEDEKARMLVAIFEQHNDDLKKLIGKEYSASTIIRYKTSLQHVKEFMQKSYGFNDINIKKLDHAFINDFNFYLRTERKCNNNSAVKYIKNFRKVIRLCLFNGWLDKDPFIQFKAKVKEVERVFLSTEELEVLQNKVFKIERIGQVRDVFVFSCYTGLAYIDTKKLTKNNIVIGIDGNYWINTHRTKTETPSNIPLLPVPMEIIEKYKTHPECINQAALLPVLSNQKMNAYLKEIADLCEINKVLTFHIARHTFATTVTLNNNVPIESVSKMLGHKNLRTTR
jgi:site-specific recombinase XerD